MWSEAQQLVALWTAVVLPVFGGLVYYVRLIVGRESEQRHLAVMIEIANIKADIDKHAFQLRTQWVWEMRKARDRGVEKEILKVNSPAIVTDKIRPYFAPIKDSLRDIYLDLHSKQGDAVSEFDLDMHIVDIHNQFLWESVCKPLGLEDGECLEAARLYAKELAHDQLDADAAAQKAILDSKKRKDTVVDVEKPK